MYAYMCMSVCLFAYVWPYTEILNWTNGYEGAHTFQIFTNMLFNVQCKLTWWVPHYLTPRRCIYWMQQRTPHRVTQRRWIYGVRETDCVWSERKELLLDCSMCQKEQEQKQSEQTVVKQARLDRRHVHSEKSSVAFSRSIGMELDSEGFIVLTCTQI